MFGQNIEVYYRGMSGALSIGDTTLHNITQEGYAEEKIKEGEKDGKVHD